MRTPIVPSQAPLICAAGFVVVVFLVAADEIFDIPFHVFGAPATPINWVEVGIEAFSILIVGVCTIAYVSRLGLKRRRAEKRVEHLNRVVRAARNVNQLIVRVKDREKLLHDVCESLIETRGYSSAWICLMDGSGEFSMGVEAGLGESFRALTEQLLIRP